MFNVGAGSGDVLLVLDNVIIIVNDEPQSHTQISLEVEPR